MADTVIFQEGPATRPNIKHDNGFLDKFPRRDPTAEEKMKLFSWRQKLGDGKIGSALGFRDLPDALDAYEHFLDGDGKDRTFSYHRFVHGELIEVGPIKTRKWGDPSGKT